MLTTDSFKRHRVLVLSWIEYVAFYMCRYSFAPILPLLVTHFSLTSTKAGILVGLAFVGYAFMLTPAGILGDRLGPKKVIISGATMSIFANFFFGYASSFSQAAAIQFLNGLSQGMAWAPMTRLMANWYPKEKMSFVMGVLATSSSLGPPITFTFCGYFGAAQGWRAAFLAPSIILASITAVFTVLVRDYPKIGSSRLRQRRKTNKSSLYRVISSIDLWFVGLSYLCYYAFVRGLLVWLPTYLVEEFNISLFASSVLTGLCSLVGIFSGFAGAWIADVKLKGNKRVVIVASLALPIPLILVVPMIRDPLLVFLILFSGFLLANLSFWLYFAYPSLLLPVELVGAGSGLIDTLGYAGTFLSALMIGFLLDLFHSYTSVFWAFALIMAAGALVSFQIRKEKNAGQKL